MDHRSLPPIFLISAEDNELLLAAKRRLRFEDAARTADDEFGDVLKRLAD